MHWNNMDFHFVVSKLSAPRVKLDLFKRVLYTHNTQIETNRVNLKINKHSKNQAIITHLNMNIRNVFSNVSFGHY